jgi:hypothetical protein
VPDFPLLKKSNSSGAQNVTLQIKIEWRKVKTCEIGSAKWCWPQQFCRNKISQLFAQWWSSTFIPIHRKLWYPFFQKRKPTHQTLVHTPHSRLTPMGDRHVLYQEPKENYTHVEENPDRLVLIQTHVFYAEDFSARAPSRAGW